MQYDPSSFNPPLGRESHLPRPLDSETTALLRGFLTPILEAAASWTDLRDRLACKGYGLEFRSGRMVILDAASEEPVCTGQHLGVPLRALATRLGRPTVKLCLGGASAVLNV